MTSSRGQVKASHVRDYLDKVIQVPLRVPQVGAEDLRAYMYSLFVGIAAPSALSEVQKCLIDALQGGWKGDTFDKAAIAALAGNPPELLDNLAIADRLAPILAWAPNVQGNPRIVKRLLNAIFLRRLLAGNRQMNVDLATLAKLAVFERCTDEMATLALYRLVMEDTEVEKHLLPANKFKGKSPVPPADWSSHEDFIAKWREMEPLFDASVNLKPAVFLSRDVMAPARSRSDLSDVAREAVAALLKVGSINSPVGKAVVEKLSVGDRRSVMSQLVDAMRQGDWSTPVPGVHGALILAKVSPEAASEFRAFLASLQVGRMDKGIRYLLKRAEMLEGA